MDISPELKFVQDMIAKGEGGEDLFKKIMSQTPSYDAGRLAGFRERAPFFDVDPELPSRGLPNFMDEGLGPNPSPDMSSVSYEPATALVHVPGVASSDPPSLNLSSDLDYDFPLSATRKKGISLTDLGTWLGKNKGMVVGGSLLAGLLGGGMIMSNRAHATAPEPQPDLGPVQGKAGEKGSAQQSSSFNPPPNFQIKSSDDAAKLLRMLSQEQFTTGNRDDQFRQISKEGKSKQHNKEQKDFYQDYTNDSFDIVKKLAEAQGVKFNNNELYKRAFLK